MKPPFYKTGISSSPLHIHDGTDNPHIGLTPNSSKDNKKSIAQEGILGAYGKVASDSKSSFTPPDLSLTDTKSPSKVSMANSGAKTGTTDFANVESRKSSDTKITGRGLLEAASYAPGIGTAAQVAIAGSELSQGNYKNAAMAGFFAIPGTKLGGGLLKGAGKLIKSGMKAFSKTPRKANKYIQAIDGTFKPGSVKHDAGKTFEKSTEKISGDLGRMNPGPNDVHMNMPSKIRTRSTKIDPIYDKPLSEVGKNQKIVPPKTNPAFDTKITSKNHPNYFKPGRTFSDLKGDGSLRMNPLPRKSTVPSTRKGMGDEVNWTTNPKKGGEQLKEHLKNQSKKKKVNDPDPRKHFGSIENPSNPNSSTIRSITDITRSRGKIIDGEDLSKATYTPFSTGTERMGITVKFKKSGVNQNYYKSSSLGGKRFTQGRLEGKDTFDKWIAFEGKGDYGNPKNKNYIKDWYVKDQGFETGYGSKTNDYMLDNLDKHIDPGIAKSATESVRAFRDKYMKLKK